MRGGKAQEGDPAEQPMDGSVKAAVDEALAARGWTPAAGAADVVILRELRNVEDERAGSEKKIWKGVVGQDLKKDPPEKTEKAVMQEVKKLLRSSRRE